MIMEEFATTVADSGVHRSSGDGKNDELAESVSSSSKASIRERIEASAFYEADGVTRKQQRFEDVEENQRREQLQQQQLCHYFVRTWES